VHSLHDDFLIEPSDCISASVIRAARLKNLHLHIDYQNVNIFRNLQVYSPFIAKSLELLVSISITKK
jgi:hypothetical protein